MQLLALKMHKNENITEQNLKHDPHGALSLANTHMHINKFTAADAFFHHSQFLLRWHEMATQRPCIKTFKINQPVQALCALCFLIECT